MILSQNYWAGLTSREGYVRPAAIVKPAIAPAVIETPTVQRLPEPEPVAAERPSLDGGCETCGDDTVDDLPAAAPIAELPAVPSAPATPEPASPAAPTADAGPAAAPSSARAVWIGLGVLVLVGGLLIVAAAARPRR